MILNPIFTDYKFLEDMSLKDLKNLNRYISNLIEEKETEDLRRLVYKVLSEDPEFLSQINELRKKRV